MPILREPLRWIFSMFVLVFMAVNLSAQTNAPAWDVSTYPFENAFQVKIKDMLPKLAAKGFGERSKSVAKCPDTGLPVYTWALEGEWIISPYTGRKFLQGPTGYFGAKQRDSLGRIYAFGGDPLKYDLPPATAALLLNPADDRARQFLSIPGNLRQQYHFAAKNWARMYGLVGKQWDAGWQQAFQDAIAHYSESRRPSDGARENAPMSISHNLVGERGHLLGGNKKDGGTENHKTMWRTSALVYAQFFPDTAKISGVPAREAARLTDSMLNDYVKRLAFTGNGEYDSQIYYPHSIGGFLNLYDFSKDSLCKQLAHAALDYYLATYGLKVYDGTIAGAQKRGYLADPKPGEMEMYLWTWGANLSRKIPEAEQLTTLNQITSSYRPNKVIMNIINKQLSLPFEAHMNRPWYHMDKAAQFYETFYASHSYGMGSVAMSMIDNPTQQTVWSLVAKGTDGPLCFGAMQPRYLNPAGHSPYTQTLQKKDALIIMTANPAQSPKASLTSSQQARQLNAAQPLVEMPVPDSSFTLAQWTQWMEQSRNSAATWFFVPKQVTQLRETMDGFFIQANQTLLYIKPLGKQIYWLNPGMDSMESLPEKHPLDILKQYNVLVSAGETSGFVVQAAEWKDYGSVEKFMEAIRLKTTLNSSQFTSGQKVQYKSLQGDALMMQYDALDLRCKGSINGKPIDYNHWANGAVYESPSVQVKNGVMVFNDGKEGYSLDCRGERPVFKPWSFGKAFFK
jgi:hypothetical protein